MSNINTFKFILARPFAVRSVTNPLPESAGYGVGGVYPAVGVQHILGDVLGVDTIYGVPDVLPSGHNEREGKEEGNSRAIVEPEDARVYGRVMGLDKALESSEYLEHGGGNAVCQAWLPPPTLTLVITGMIILTLGSLFAPLEVLTASRPGIRVRVTRVSNYLKEKYRSRSLGQDRDTIQGPGVTSDIPSPAIIHPFNRCRCPEFPLSEKMLK